MDVPMFILLFTSSLGFLTYAYWCTSGFLALI